MITNDATSTDTKESTVSSTITIEQRNDGWYISDGQGYEAGPFPSEQAAQDDRFYWDE